MAEDKYDHGTVLTIYDVLLGSYRATVQGSVALFLRLFLYIRLFVTQFECNVRGVRRYVQGGEDA